MVLRFVVPGWKSNALNRRATVPCAVLSHLAVDRASWYQIMGFTKASPKLSDVS